MTIFTVAGAITTHGLIHITCGEQAGTALISTTAIITMVILGITHIHTITHITTVHGTMTHGILALGGIILTHGIGDTMHTTILGIGEATMTHGIGVATMTLGTIQVAGIMAQEISTTVLLDSTLQAPWSQEHTPEVSRRESLQVRAFPLGLPEALSPQAQALL